MINPNVPSTTPDITPASKGGFTGHPQLKGGYEPEQRRDAFLNPVITDQEMAAKKNFDAPGHIARPGVADRIDAAFQASHPEVVQSQEQIQDS